MGRQVAIYFRQVVGEFIFRQRGSDSRRHRLPPSAPHPTQHENEHADADGDAYRRHDPRHEVEAGTRGRSEDACAVSGDEEVLDLTFILSFEQLFPENPFHVLTDLDEGLVERLAGTDRADQLAFESLCAFLELPILVRPDKRRARSVVALAVGLGMCGAD